HRPRVGGGAIAKLNPRENRQPSTDPASVEATTGSYATAATRQRRTVAHPPTQGRGEPAFSRGFSLDSRCLHRHRVGGGLAVLARV
ncbi:MAG TPA: hypothetical protein VFF31_18210, partial [Blastocatellia bacterium]|nr:hypothetical protein [Blastocatellia bacterium]